MVLRVAPEENWVVEHGCGDKRHADRPRRVDAWWQVLRAGEVLHQFLRPVGPDGLLRDTDVITHHAGPLRDRQPALGVDRLCTITNRSERVIVQVSEFLCMLL